MRMLQRDSHFDFALSYSEADPTATYLRLSILKTDITVTAKFIVGDRLVPDTKVFLLSELDKLILQARCWQLDGSTYELAVAFSNTTYFDGSRRFQPANSFVSETCGAYVTLAQLLELALGLKQIVQAARDVHKPAVIVILL